MNPIRPAFRLTALAAAAALAVGCASTPRMQPEVIALQNELQRLSTDTRIAPHAAAELRDAQLAVQVITADQHRMSPRDFDQSLYLADRLLDIAEAEGLARYATARGQSLDREREQLLADARAREAAYARRDAERARIEAEEARLSSALARSNAERALRETELARLQAERERALAEQGQRAAEEGQRAAELARLEAERARAEAEAARRALVDMQAELAELQTKQTERGLIVTIGDVLFEVDRAELRPGARRELDKLVSALRDNPEFNLVIEGHTDSTGSAGYNLDLSERRANAVRGYLAANGISPDRLQTVGLGQEYPIASNNDAYGRQQNRRVEIVIQSPEQAQVTATERD